MSRPLTWRDYKEAIVFVIIMAIFGVVVCGYVLPYALVPDRPQPRPTPPTAIERLEKP